MLAHWSTAKLQHNCVTELTAPHTILLAVDTYLLKAKDAPWAPVKAGKHPLTHWLHTTLLILYGFPFSWTINAHHISRAHAPPLEYSSLFWCKCSLTCQLRNWILKALSPELLKTKDWECHTCEIFFFSFGSPMSTSLKWKVKHFDSIICAHPLTEQSLYLCQTSAFDSSCCFSKSVIKKQAPISSKFATVSCGKWTVTSMKGKKPQTTKKHLSVNTCHWLSSNKTSWTKLFWKSSYYCWLSNVRNRFLRKLEAFLVG